MVWFYYMEGQPKVLIIEDDEFLSSLVKARLEKEGYEVRRVFDGLEAFELLREYTPDMIILDLIMPRMSGFELLEAISVDAQLNRIPVVTLTNLGQEEDIQKAKTLGVREYFIKARTSIDEIVKTVKNIVPLTVSAPATPVAPSGDAPPPIPPAATQIS